VTETGATSVDGTTATSDTTDTTSHTGSERPTRRRDIQGLRALAVVAIIASHVTQWPSGGFVGVDVFFVISGFLITGLMLREYDLTGRLSLARFYGRRLRRIVPAALTVLLATSTVGYFLFNTTRAWETIWDAVYSLFFAANWRFAAVGVDYFHATSPASPLQHYWSLAVEEQFYLLWPVVMLATLLLATSRLRDPRRIRWAVGAVMAVIVAASLVFAFWQTAAMPTVAYFSTFTRIWELGIGALLAIAAPVFIRMTRAARFLVGWAGLAGIVTSFVVITSDVPFPAPWALLPVLSTAAVIVAGIGGPQRHLFPLVNPVSTFIGNISYSLYLWHFPVLVFLLMLMPDQTLQVTAIIVGATVLLAVMSYYLVEQPFQRSPLLESFNGSAEARSEAWADWREKFGTRFILSSIAVLAMITVVTFTINTSLNDSIPVAAPAPVAGSEENPEIQLQADLTAAVSAAAWPDNLSPSLDRVMSTTSNNNPARDCFNIGDTPRFDRCTWGSDDAPNHMYLVGDSTAMAYAPAFRAIADDSAGQWRITTVGLYGCRFTEVAVQNDGAGVMDSCEQRKSDIAAQISSDQPQLVVVSNAFALGQTPTRVPLSVSTLVASAVEEAAQYNAAGRIVYLAAPPLGAELGQCYSPVSSPQDCNSPVGQTWLDFAAATDAAKGSDRFITSLPFICANDLCPAFAGTLPTRYDSVHLTVEYSTHIAPALKHALVAVGAM
jgi:peptidoglycan/LPS O-acetylase OafA/YrhL